MCAIAFIIITLSSFTIIGSVGYDTMTIMVGEHFYRTSKLTPNIYTCRNSFHPDLKTAILPVNTAKKCAKYCIRNFTWCLAFRIFDTPETKLCIIGEISEGSYSNCYPYYRVPVCRIRGLSWGGKDSPSLAKEANVTVLLGIKISITSNGINILTFDPLECVFTNHLVFDTFSKIGEANRFKDFIEALEEGVVLIGVIHYDASTFLSQIYNYLNSIYLNVRDIKFGGKFAFALIKNQNMNRTVVVKSSSTTPMYFAIDVYGRYMPGHDSIHFFIRTL